MSVVSACSDMHVCVCVCVCVWLSLHTCLWTECRHHIQELNKAHHISTRGGKDLTDPIPEGVCLRNSKKEYDVQSAFYTTLILWVFLTPYFNFCWALASSLYLSLSRFVQTYDLTTPTI